MAGARSQAWDLSTCPNRRRPRESLVVVLVLAIEAQTVDDENKDEGDLVAAPQGCAEVKSCTLPRVGERRRAAPLRRSAEYNSAIREIENLRCHPALTAA